MGLGRTAWGLVRLCRPFNALLAAFAVVVGLLLSAPPPLPDFGCVLPLRCDGPSRLVAPFPIPVAAALAALLLTAFGNVLNDVRDVEVDRVAHPTRPLPRGDVGRRAAFRMMGVLLSLGLAAAALAGVWPLVFATGVVGLLLLYELRLKRLGLPGNVAVAVLTACTFLFGAVAQGPPYAMRLAAVSATMALFVNLAREVAKDAQDMEAERGVRRTFPMQVGLRGAGVAALVFAAAGILASVPFVAWHQPCMDRQDFMVLAGLILAADAAVAVGGLLAPSSPAWAQRLLKLGMAVALVAFFFATPDAPCAQG